MDDPRELRDTAASTDFHATWTKGGPVFSYLPDDALRSIEGAAIASFGDAATLGFWAFATGIWTTGLFQSGVLPQSAMPLLVPGLLIYAGIVLFIAGLLLYRRDEAFFASAFCSFAALNMSRAVLMILQQQGVLPHDATATVLQGCLIESFAFIALSLLGGAVRINVVAALIMGCTFVGYALSGLPFITNQMTAGGWAEAGRIGGYWLFAAGAFAYYAGTALLVNTAWRRIVLPIGGQA